MQLILCNEYEETGISYPLSLFYGMTKLMKDFNDFT